MLEGGVYPGVYVGLTGVDGGTMLGVRYPEFVPGTHETQYLGSMDFTAALGDASVGLGAYCFYAASEYTPEPCTLELLELERGDELVPSNDPESEWMVERGSYVRMRVSCPEEGLYSPGADDYGPSRRAFSPSEFEVEAYDCETDREP